MQEIGVREDEMFDRRESAVHDPCMMGKAERKI